MSWFIIFYLAMYLLSSGRRWEVFVLEENGKTYAIKKAKDNTKKGSIQREITILKYLRWKVDFVPQILDYWDDWFKYEFLPGVTLSKAKLSFNQLKEIYKKLVDYAYKLDLLNVEHWELSRPTKNIIVNFPKVYIIDFERGNLINKSFKNLKWIAQFLLWKQVILKEDLKFDNPENFKEFLTKKIGNVK